jgi:phosphatidylserine/phosphatidylglycerophosphate/cardiolipin synthase-like enzyme
MSARRIRAYFGVLAFCAAFVPAAAAAQGIVAFDALGPGAVCFTSGHGSTVGADCTAVVVEAIAAARSSLDIQAYNFTAPRIVAAVIAAHRRGVRVTMLIDKITAHQRGEGVSAVSAAGVPVFVDAKPKIAHNKVMIIDGATVITGSFNFSRNAACCNAENLLVVHAPALAAAYAANFARRRRVSVAWAAAAASSRRLGPPARAKDEDRGHHQERAHELIRSQPLAENEEGQDEAGDRLDIHDHRHARRAQHRGEEQD